MGIFNLQIRIEKNWYGKGHHRFEMLLIWDWHYGQFVFVMKNWLDNPIFGCTFGPKLIEEYLQIENDMM
jgi:hypothetical protein